jgi:thymidylate synthase (FAD)
MPQIIKPSFTIETQLDGAQILREIERYARNCYKSEGKIGDFGDTKKFVGNLLHTRKHEGIVDHHIITVRVICDRGVSHEIVRHRIAAYLQESTRYCDYAKSGEIGAVDLRPFLASTDQIAEWWNAMVDAERHYNQLRAMGCSPQIARSVLPNSLKTEIIMSLNIRSWRNFFRLRACSMAAHPQMREIACPLLQEFKRRIPVLFDDLEPCY